MILRRYRRISGLLHLNVSHLQGHLFDPFTERIRHSIDSIHDHLQSLFQLVIFLLTLCMLLVGLGE